MLLHERVKALAADLPVGVEAGEHLCPKCGGGPSRDRAFSIRRTPTEILFICYRASCGFAGRLPAAWHTPVGRRAPRALQVFTGRFEAIPPWVSKLLLSRYRIGQDVADKEGILWTPSYGGRLVLPVKDIQGRVEGYVFRALDRRSPKSIYREVVKDAVGLAWYGAPSSSVVLVEDQLSAIRASRFMTAAALLGVNVNDEKLTSILRAGVKEVVVALDNDATGRAVKIGQRISGLVHCRVVMLDSDIKDSDDSEVEKLLC